MPKTKKLAPKATKIDHSTKDMITIALEQEKAKNSANGGQSALNSEDTPLPFMENTSQSQITEKPTTVKITPQAKYYKTTFYLTKRHQKALKMKAALSDRVEDKDQSAIVRALLDIHLADILKQVE